VDGVAGLDVALLKGLLVIQLFSSLNELNHSDVDTNSLLQVLLNDDDLVGGFEVELLVGASESLHVV